MRVVDAGRAAFRAKLADSIDRAHFSQSDVARRVNVERSAVNAWVKGRRTPDLETTRKLASIFNWPVGEMLSWFGIYEAVQLEDAEQPKVDTSAGESGIILAAPSGLTPDVRPLPHTVARPPDSETIPVPSLSHRSAYYLLAQLPPEIVETEVIPSMSKRVAAFKAGREPHEKAEGG